MQQPSAVYVVNKVNSKNHYYETFSLYLACFKKTSCNFYWLWLDYYAEIWLIYACSKIMRLFRRHEICYKKIQLLPTQYKNE